MDLIRTDDPRYDEARTVFNAMVDKRPAVIAECASAGGRRRGTRAGEGRELRLAVRAGGHSVAGMSINDGGLVVDVRPMNQIDDRSEGAHGPGRRRRHVERVRPRRAGARPRDDRRAGVDHRCRRLHVGRRLGLARTIARARVRQPRSVDLITADGRAVTASATENPELFWALHGGGGNFGIATVVRVRSQPGRPDRARGSHAVAGRLRARRRPASTAMSCATCRTRSAAGWCS